MTPSPWNASPWNVTFAFFLCVTAATAFPNMQFVNATQTEHQLLSYLPDLAAAAALEDGTVLVAGGISNNHLLGETTVHRYDPAKNVWTTVASLSTSRAGLGLVRLGGNVYAIGGTTVLPIPGGGIDRRSVEVYDAAADKWTQVAQMHAARPHVAAAVVDGKVYAGGAVDVSSTDVTTIEVYDPAADTWTFVVNPKSWRSGVDSLAFAALHRKLYTIRGDDDVNQVHTYDPATNKWSSLASMNHYREFCRAAALGGKLYAIGGRSVSSAGEVSIVPTVEAYDPATNKWTDVANMTEARTYAAVAVAGDKLYVMGGTCVLGGGGCQFPMDVYDPAADKWTGWRPVA